MAGRKKKVLSAKHKKKLLAAAQTPAAKRKRMESRARTMALKQKLAHNTRSEIPLAAIPDRPPKRGTTLKEWANAPRKKTVDVSAPGTDILAQLIVSVYRHLTKGK